MKPAFSHEWLNVLLAVVLFSVYIALPAGYGFRIWKERTECGALKGNEKSEDRAGELPSPARINAYGAPETTGKDIRTPSLPPHRRNTAYKLLRIWKERTECGALKGNEKSEDRAGDAGGQQSARFFYALAGCMVLCGLTATR